MMKTMTDCLLALAVCALLLSPGEQLRAQSEPSIGLLSKVILDVTRKPADQDWLKAERGQTLDSGDRIRTGEKSLAIVKFKDNSLVRVRERSEVIITGSTSGAGFSKQVTLSGGAIGFSVKKQQANEEFRFTAPTSVASIRGTMGLFAVEDTSDLLLVTEGLVNLTNTTSQNTVGIEAGQAGVSYASGRVEKRPITDAELQLFQSLFSGTDSGQRGKELKLQLRNERGELRELIIELE
jgi:FecR protein